MAKFRVGVDTSCLHRYRVGGMETYINNLLACLKKMEPLPIEIVPLRGPRYLPQPWGEIGSLNMLIELFWLQAMLPFVARRQGLHLLHMPAHVHAPWSRLPQVVTLHDAHAYVTPKAHPFGVRHYIRIFDTMAAKSAIRIITPSQMSKHDLIKYHHAPPDRVLIVPLGCRRMPRTTAPHPHPEWKPYLFYLGVLKPHKNVPRLVQAFHQLLQDPRHAGRHLVLAGPKFGEDAPVVEDLVRTHRLEGRVHQIGTMDDDALAVWYRDAALFAFPSLNEGHGHPPLEAMQFGVPVVAAKAAALPETLGDAAEYAEDPSRVESITEAFRRVLEHPERIEELRQKGPARAALYTWERHAERMVQIYLDALQEAYGRTAP